MNTLNAVTHAWTEAGAVLVPLAEEIPDPADVRPGLLGFGAFVFLILAVVFLSLSFRKQLKKVNFEEPANGTHRAPGGAAGATAITGEPGEQGAPGGPAEPGRHRAGDDPEDQGRRGEPHGS